MHIRPAHVSDAPAIAVVHVDSLKTTYAGIIPDEVLAGFNYGDHERDWSEFLSDSDGTKFGYVAEDGSGRIISLASGGPERKGDPVYRGQLYKLYILASHQRRGIGSELTRSVAGRLLDNGVRSMLAWVLAKNPSRHFYEGMGAAHLYDKDVTFGDASLVLCAYGWRDMRGLIET